MSEAFSTVNWHVLLWLLLPLAAMFTLACFHLRPLRLVTNFESGPTPRTTLPEFGRNPTERLCADRQQVTIAYPCSRWGIPWLTTSIR
ncbi:hypothetical protein AUEXF2481DRAFT_39684 [Aureobasidium subglaciale EXF-2481]|uniref:Uncharacterized protein n=1 Tax=Aureobasidium subglaciale (strain EXF-2481) TaxID=1043005 RepID=A0A074YDD9_AURSE|nr:uncharacterized protein AUEXF2481DRAFT_39684 [Aureobasidium subglaciale EXF-2481]KEQ95828.1 hypothetical protein AUEXF2481DRAFT_39684 [Aureobasidium subglaciale EXF-2481]